MECTICGKECTGKTCSGPCRAKLSRRTRTQGAHAPRRTVDLQACKLDPREQPIGHKLCNPDLSPPDVNLTNPDTPEAEVAAMVHVLNFGRPDCTCQHCQNNRANGSKHVLNHRAFKTAAELGDKELNRVSLPGDADYVGVAV